MIFLWPMVKHVRLQTCTVYEESIECVSVNLEVSQKSDYWEPCTRSWTKNGLSTFQTFGFVTQVLKYHILTQNKPILRGLRKTGFSRAVEGARKNAFFSRGVRKTGWWEKTVTHPSANLGLLSDWSSPCKISRRTALEWLVQNWMQGQKQVVMPFRRKTSILNKIDNLFTMLNIACNRVDLSTRQESKTAVRFQDPRPFFSKKSAKLLL